MSKVVRIWTIDDVENDEDLLRYYSFLRKMMLSFARELANNAAELNAMLKAHDKRAGVKRRHKVVRPMGVAAGVLILVCRYITLSSKRFQVEYQPEIDAGRGTRKPRTGNRTIRFGG